MLHLAPLSQYLDISEPRWQNRACGIVALKIALDTLDYQTPDLKTMIQTGVEQNAYLPGIGWKHAELAKLSEHYGANGTNYDWAALSPEEAWVKLTTYLGQTPVLVSIHSHFDPTTKDGHLIVLAGEQTGQIIYADPEIKDRDQIITSIDRTKFLAGWKRRVIIIS